MKFFNNGVKLLLSFRRFPDELLLPESVIPVIRIPSAARPWSDDAFFPWDESTDALSSEPGVNQLSITIRTYCWFARLYL